MKHLTPYIALEMLIPAASLSFQTELERESYVMRIGNHVARKTREVISFETVNGRTTIKLIDNEWHYAHGEESTAELMIAAGVYYAKTNNLA